MVRACKRAGTPAVPQSPPLPAQQMQQPKQLAAPPEQSRSEWELAAQRRRLEQRAKSAGDPQHTALCLQHLPRLHAAVPRPTARGGARVGSGDALQAQLLQRQPRVDRVRLLAERWHRRRAAAAALAGPSTTEGPRHSGAPHS